MTRRLLLLLVAVVAMAMLYAMQASRPRCSGFSFAYPGGDCVVWYARDGDQILDLVIAPRATFAACYNAAACRLRVGDAEVAFGSTDKAYVFEAGEWHSAALGGLKESELPNVGDIERCRSTGEIARKVLGR
jgi:hypothetical protein